MQLQTVKVELGGGDTAIIYTDVLRITARLHEAELRKCMTLVDKSGKGGKALLSELEQMETMPKADFEIDMSKVDDDAINEIFVLNQVVKWTFGAVDHETLETKVTREQYKALIKEMDRLYKPIPLAGSAA